MGNARQPFCTRPLTTHQLEVDSKGIKESDIIYYTGGRSGGQIEGAWLGQDTGEAYTLCDQCLGFLYDHSEGGSRF